MTRSSRSRTSSGTCAWANPAYQASLDAADEIGLAVLATTMAIVAVFFPVALMPGIAGQYFKAFGFTVVLSVLMSLLVARMITPLIAAYFLRSHGAQPHAAWKWMDCLSEGPQLEPRHVQGPRAARQAAEACAAGSAIMRSLACSCCRLRRVLRRGHGRRDGRAWASSAWPGAIDFVLALARRRARRLWRGQADQLRSSSCRARRFRASGTGSVAARWNARMQRSSAGDGRRGLAHPAAQHHPVRHPARCPSSRRRTAIIRGSTSPCRRAARSSRPRR